jgi:hypothetical protein
MREVITGYLYLGADESLIPRIHCYSFSYILFLAVVLCCIVWTGNAVFMGGGGGGPWPPGQKKTKKFFEHFLGKGQIFHHHPD